MDLILSVGIILVLGLAISVYFSVPLSVGVAGISLTYLGWDFLTLVFFPLNSGAYNSVPITTNLILGFPVDLIVHMLLSAGAGFLAKIGL